jgi:hypothetical protein
MESPLGMAAASWDGVNVVPFEEVPTSTPY